MSVDTCIEELPNIHQKVSLTSVKVTAAKYFYNRNEWHVAKNSYHCDVIATIITKIHPCCHVLLPIQYQVNVTSFPGFMDQIVISL